MKHLTDSLSYCLEMERLLFPDPRQRVSEALIYHPAPNIIIQSRKLIKELTDDILVAVENESGQNISTLMDLCISPIVTPEAIYKRNDKGSVRRSNVTGEIGRTLYKILASNDVSKELQDWYHEVRQQY